MVLLGALVAAILGLGAHLAIDYTRYTRGEAPLVEPMRWTRRVVFLLLVVAPVAWVGAGLTTQHRYATQRGAVQRQAEQNCRSEPGPEHGSVAACVTVRMGDWSDSFPPPEWFPW
jgi:hypothetical protein